MCETQQPISVELMTSDVILCQFVSQSSSVFRIANMTRFNHGHRYGRVLTSKERVKKFAVTTTEDLRHLPQVSTC